MLEKSQCPICGITLPEVVPGDLCPRCTLDGIFGQQEEPSLVGQVPEISGLTVHEEIGEGGFGIVYRATQTGTMRRRVALKVLKPGVDTRQVLRRFEIERQALALLEHPNIARIYEAGETDGGYPWFTMEYVEGLSVAEAFSGRSLREIVEGFLPICSAILYAHGKGVLHRDLKPSNILVSSEGMSKVIDFGVAKSLDANKSPGMTAYTGGDGCLGTMAYMAPEQADPKGVDSDERVDVYSLGAILYELVTGLNPHDAREDEDRLVKPSRLAIGEVSSDLDEVILRAMALDREDRYPSVAAFSLDLHRFLNDERIVRQSKKRRWWLPWVAGVGGLAVAVAGVISLLNRKIFEGSGTEVVESGELWHEAKGWPHYLVFDRKREKALAFYRGVGAKSVIFDSRTGEKIATLQDRHAHVRSAAFSYDGKQVLVGYLNGAMRRFDIAEERMVSAFRSVRLTEEDYPCDFVFEFQEDEETLTATVADYKVMSIRQRDGSVIRTLPTGHYRSGAIRDGSRILFGSHEGPLALWDLGGKVKILEGHGPRFYEIVASRDGRFFASADHHGKVGVWDVGGHLRQMLDHPMACFGVAISGDSRRVATGSNDGVVRIWDMESGELREELVHFGRVSSLDFSGDDQYLVTGGEEGVLRVWDVSQGALVVLEKDLRSAIDVVRFNEEGHVMVMTFERGVFFEKLERLLSAPR